MRLSIPAFGSNKSAAQARRPVTARSVWSLAFERFAYNRLALAGLGLLAVLILLSIFASVLAPFNPIKRDFSVTMSPPSAAHWLGTDPLGRDVYTRVLYG